uniref:Uncharacterized protein n=1 Tax=viral metagenome TaxID=1070528 RepID=A0A6C0HGZ2_9ZZZZ
MKWNFKLNGLHLLYIFLIVLFLFYALGLGPTIESFTDTDTTQGTGMSGVARANMDNAQNSTAGAAGAGTGWTKGTGMSGVTRANMDNAQNQNGDQNSDQNSDQNGQLPSFLQSISEKAENMIYGNDDNTSNNIGKYGKQQGSSSSSYIGPAGDTVLVDNPRQPLQIPMPKQPQPLGIPKSQIPAGNEDMYILKSQVIPPVCPACPTMSSCPRPAPYPPCPPCSRCPEPAFDCKKVPNYKNAENSYLPRPVLANFSQFGM